MAATQPKCRSALAAAIALAITGVDATAAPRAGIRLVLDDVISSRIEDETAAVDSRRDGRVEMNALIQSHPDPLFAELETRYRALPPFTQARETIPETYIAEASARERLMENVSDAAAKAASFVPHFRTQVRQDTIVETSDPDAAGNAQRASYETLLATVNPTFMYETDQRKWALRATYDYERGQYAHDKDADVRDHVVDVAWTRRLGKGSQLRVSGLIEDTHDRTTEDPILDFGSALESRSLAYNRYFMNILYRNGTQRDRTRYDVYLYREDSELEADDLLGGGYVLDRSAVGGMYAWQLRRQFALVGEAKYQRFDYEQSFRDNTHYRALAGVDLVLGRRLKSKLRLGYEQKSFDLSIQGNSIGETVWDGAVEWALRRSTSVSLETGRDIFELATVDRPIDAAKFNIQSWIKTGWRQQWSEKLMTEASYTWREIDFEGIDNREQATQLLLTADYQLTNHWTLSLDGAYTHQESDVGADLRRRTFTFRTHYAL